SLVGGLEHDRTDFFRQRAFQPHGAVAGGGRKAEPSQIVLAVLVLLRHPHHQLGPFRNGYVSFGFQQGRMRLVESWTHGPTAARVAVDRPWHVPTSLRE